MFEDGLMFSSSTGVFDFCTGLGKLRPPSYKFNKVRYVYRD